MIGDVKTSEDLDVVGQSHFGTNWLRKDRPPNASIESLGVVVGALPFVCFGLRFVRPIFNQFRAFLRVYSRGREVFFSG